MADLDASNWLLDIDIPSSHAERSHLEQYLSDPIEPNVANPLKWWWDKRTVWPELSAMALDYLSIPCESY
jgi:hypothetical protein